MIASRAGCASARMTCGSETSRRGPSSFTQNRVPGARAERTLAPPPTREDRRMTLPTDLQDELTAERAHLTESRAALRRRPERPAALFATGEDVAGDAYSAETLGRTLSRRVRELADDPNTPLFFGRLDFGYGPAAEDHAGHDYHIGRRHVTDEAGEPMVLDW